MSKATKRETKQEAAQAANVFQFTLAGLVVFSLALIGGSSFVGYKLAANNRPKLADTLAVDQKDKTSSAHAGAWGTLLTRNIELERPVEYLTDEVANPKPEVWTFANMTPDAVKSLFAKSGLSGTQIADAFGSVTAKNSGTELMPAEKFLLSLTSAQREKLFTTLAGTGVNLYIDYPYIFPADDVEGVYTDSRLHPEDVALLKQLIYPNGSAQQLSDYAFLLQKIPTNERRTAMTQALSRQSAVLARLAVNADTDIDKIAAYWGNMPNVRFTDTRPLLESLKQLPEGGTISLLYLLPKFARERLYTFPLPSQSGDPVMDCHWSTFNFCNDTPDNRFNDPNFAVEYIRKNFYQIAAPSVYGDIVLLMNEKQEVKHSAVFIADDIVFTKNGNNYRQPWMLMRIPDLLATYPANPPMKTIFMRRKTD
jgi:hypothetical protein